MPARTARPRWRRRRPGSSRPAGRGGWRRRRCRGRGRPRGRRGRAGDRAGPSPTTSAGGAPRAPRPPRCTGSRSRRRTARASAGRPVRAGPRPAARAVAIAVRSLRTTSATASTSSDSSAARVRSVSGNAVSGLPPTITRARRLPAAISSAMPAHGSWPSQRGRSGRDAGPSDAGRGFALRRRGEPVALGGEQVAGVAAHPALTVEGAGHDEQRPAQPLGDDAAAAHGDAGAGHHRDPARGAHRVQQAGQGRRVDARPAGDAVEREGRDRGGEARDVGRPRWSPSSARSAPSASSSRTRKARIWWSVPGSGATWWSASAAVSERRGSRTQIRPPADRKSRSRTTGSARVVPYPCDTTGLQPMITRSRERSCPKPG